MKALIFNSVKLDVLEVVRPMSKILQETSLLSPTLLTTCTVTMENISWMSDLIENWKEEGKIKELFPHILKVLDSLKKESANLIPDWYEVAMRQEMNRCFMGIQ